MHKKSRGQNAQNGAGAQSNSAQNVELVGKSDAMQKIQATVKRYASLNQTVLITGESGVGKEVVALQLHFAGKRATFPFIEKNCGAIPETLVESELFGTVKGSFTDAGNVPGAFRAASHGTLFLDEIGDMPLTTQVKVLRVLQEKRVTPLGATQSHSVDVRVVAATNVNLDDAIRQGSFRHDLFYRLKVLQIHIPPLRDRPEDVEVLAKEFLHRLNTGEPNMPEKKITPEGYCWLRNEAEWGKGNARELDSTINQAFIHSDLLELGVKELRTAYEDQLSSEPELLEPAVENQSVATPDWIRLPNKRMLRLLSDFFGADSPSVESEVRNTMAQIMETLLITSEPGFRHDRIAKAIHDCGRRKNKPFVRVDCAAFSESEALQRELFGEKGIRNKGAFNRANRGTLFVNQVGKMPMAVQQEFCQVLNTREFTPVGGTRKIKVGKNIRIIVAAEDKWDAAVKEGKIDESLANRIQHFHIDIPPLRERRDDIPRFIMAFIADFKKNEDVDDVHITDEELNWLKKQSWPYNMRQLRQVVFSSCHTCIDDADDECELAQVELCHVQKTYEKSLIKPDGDVRSVPESERIPSLFGLTVHDFCLLITETQEITLEDLTSWMEQLPSEVHQQTKAYPEVSPEDFSRVASEAAGILSRITDIPSDPIFLRGRTLRQIQSEVYRRRLKESDDNASKAAESLGVKDGKTVLKWAKKATPDCPTGGDGEKDEWKYHEFSTQSVEELVLSKVDSCDWAEMPLVGKISCVAKVLAAFPKSGAICACGEWKRSVRKEICVVVLALAKNDEKQASKALGIWLGTFQKYLSGEG